MSVFTPVPEPVLADWLKGYAIGRLVELKGISAGVQNSNFFVTTTLGRYVLTLFEDMPRAELPYYLHLMAHLSRHGLPVPGPIANRDNEYLGTLQDRPAALVVRLSGGSEMQPGITHCEKVGAMLAGLHLAGQSYGRRQENPRGAGWRDATAQAVRPFLPAGEQALLDAELAFQATVDATALPAGAIHADLFRDNVLWDRDEDGTPHIGGVIDFYFAGFDALLFDVAVTVNDWCTQADGQLDPARTRALLDAYHAERPFGADEHAAWPAMLRAAALRFWLSRAADFHRPRSGEMVLVKDPDEYRDILRLRAAGVPPLPR
ncbi:homoserine kinase [Thauera linaloolentis]|uniref:Homoserine kinase n=1 Tax=Thauera linaloolentis (strain DSM 12138 / JCM 21573 / CCUG 41526 / CIP 105981 / IAM 15112 / NBRC 102519 / 47Lol) TaxID=1123367 RepID=N6Y6Q9_THAL4|nr:homoserine kinase [Thauera linaloolentis]ENO89881.1 homoserine kinase [Thauera linaloolentis 47Lol = DSM 12138]MCM8564572.1 homoserine kinase [Thauera linaloolentis]